MYKHIHIGDLIRKRREEIEMSMAGTFCFFIRKIRIRKVKFLLIFATMNSFVRKITIKLFSFAMIAVMGLLIINKGIYTHSHKLENGKVYTHAHPYNKTNDSKPFKSHHHTKAEFLFYENLEILFFSLYLIAISSLIFKRIQLYNYNEEKYIQFFFNSNLGRAPPLS